MKVSSWKAVLVEAGVVEVLFCKLVSAKVFLQKFCLQAALLEALCEEVLAAQGLFESKLGQVLCVKLLWRHSAEPSCCEAACSPLLLGSKLLEAVLCKLLFLSR